MAIEGIAAVALRPEGAGAIGMAEGRSSSMDFGVWLQQQLGEVNRQVLEGDAKVAELAAGGDVQLHDVMLSLEQAKLSFELVLAIRNKALEAYQDLMRMQI